MARMMTRRTAATAMAAVALSAPRPVGADGNVDVQLVLAVDTSGSVNRERFELQRLGYVAAFRTPAVLKTIRSGQTGAAAITMTQWTGPAQQVQVVPWTRISNRDEISAFARAIEETPRRLYGGGTSISGAIDHARTLFPSCPYPTIRRTIDVSGDGATNRGRASSAARDDAVADGITINGLPILALERDLDDHYREQVIGGPGAFMVVTETFENFAEAVRRKLIQELAWWQTSPPVTHV
jgi:hypothetical protein